MNTLGRMGWTSAGLVSATLLAACAQPPTQQLEVASKGVEAARSAGAPQYAEEEFVKLEQEFNQTKEELARQERTFTIFRSYSKADEMLRRVKEQAQRVEVAATTKKAEAKTAAEAGEQEAQSAVAATRELLAKAPVGKDRAAIEPIKQDMTGMEAELPMVHALIEKGEYLEAEVQAKALKEKAGSVSNELQKALEKVNASRARVTKHP